MSRTIPFIHMRRHVFAATHAGITLIFPVSLCLVHDVQRISLVFYMGLPSKPKTPNDADWHITASHVQDAATLGKFRIWR